MRLFPANVAAETADLTARELGALMRLAFHLWETDEVPQTAAAIAKVTGLGLDAAESARSKLLKFFESGALFAIMRAVDASRYERRAQAGRLGGLRMKAGEVAAEA